MEPSNSTSSDDTLANDSFAGDSPKIGAGGEQPEGLRKREKSKREGLRSDIAQVVARDEPSPDKVWAPKQHANRTLVLCFDGTGDHFDSDNSNVVQLVSMLRKDDTSQQLVYYQPGIGTYTGVEIPVISSISKTLDDMFAVNLSTHIKQGYTFLMQNYTQGDKICLFGFSRGAYTARALAGMLQKVGLLPLSNDVQLPFAYDMYAHVAVTSPGPGASDAAIRAAEEEIDLVETFKRTFCREVTIEFLGVWDTVASVGFFPRYLPFIASNNGIRYLRHALSSDERRVRFLPSYVAGGRSDSDSPRPSPSSSPVTSPLSSPTDESFVSSPKQENAVSDSPTTDEPYGQEGLDTDDENDVHGMLKRKDHTRPEAHHRMSVQKLYEDALNARQDESDVEEVWFAGVHADVGGGSVHNDTTHALARIPLRWIIRECFRCDTGIQFDGAMLQQIGLGLSLNPHTREVSLPLDPPERIRGDAPPEDGDDEDQQEEESTPGFFSRVVSALARPFVTVASVVLGRHAANGWISPSARGASGSGRRLVAGRMRADRAHALIHGVSPEEHKRQGKRVQHPHAIDVRKTVEVDPGYEAREERRDARSPLFDQLGAASGTTRLLWLLMEWMPMRIKKEHAIVNMEKGGWRWIWNRGQGRKIYTREMREGLKVHRSIKTRLESVGAAGLSHPLSRHGEDTHIEISIPSSIYDTASAGKGGKAGEEKGERTAEVYVPQVRPKFPGKHRQPERLSYAEWNVEVPKFWTWAS